MKKLSIIVPVYNVEKYLEQCVTSIIDGNFNNYEVILVDDGSKDTSGDICDKLANRYEEVKVIHQENKGLSGARNTGIKEATGEYLMFVDSDDFIKNNKNFIEIVNNLTEDIIQYKMIYYYEKKDEYLELKDINIYDNLDTKNKILKLLLDGDLSISACNKIIKRQILIDNNLFFDETLLSEDIDWSLRLFMKVKSFKVINENVYVYRQQREGSITTTVKPKTIESLYKIISYWLDYNYEDNEYKEAYMNYMAYEYVVLLGLMNSKNCNKELKKKIYSLKHILIYDKNRKVKIAKKCFKVFGIKFGRVFLKLYLFLKNNNILKI